MDRKSTEEEKAALLMKFFDYAESPIQEWLADYLGVDVTELFADYQDNSDVLGFQLEDNKKHCDGYLINMEYGTDCYIDKTTLDKSVKYKKTCSMLFDAVHQVFPAVIGTVDEKYREQLKNLRPLFDNNTMSFKLHCINQSAAELNAAVESKRQLVPYLAQTEQFDTKTMDNIRMNLTKCDAVIEKNSKSVLDEEEAKCRALNEQLNKINHLYIVVEESDEHNMTDFSLSRLPLFGLQYQDPEEDSIFDTLKKEMDD
jgi:hypothetical protein